MINKIRDSPWFWAALAAYYTTLAVINFRDSMTAAGILATVVSALAVTLTIAASRKRNG